MDRLAAMRTFVEIVDRGSLTAAAVALDRSQPTVVRALASLEEHLGATLLRRTTRRMSLTGEGRDYLERCRRILADVEDAERAVSQDEEEPRGDLRVTAPVQFGKRYIAPLVTRFLDRHPRVRVDLILVDRLVDLVDEGIDLALRIGPLADSTLVASRVGHVRRVVCASPGRLAESGCPDHPSELSQLPCIRQESLAPGTVWRFREAGRVTAVPVQGRFATNQIAAAVAACIDGAGFGKFLSYQVQPYVDDGRLRLVLEDFEPEPWPISLVYPSGRILPTRLRALVKQMQQSLRGHADLAQVP
ncbi:LysR family transcriptional regulator [Elongatibacter sediminis]|uniref:LysR family transcriptional regulator n=1 Tax=Elongatibacter sediminis TaxID=3119006 RepID=A0AAW9RE05_9GAMM